MYRIRPISTLCTAAVSTITVQSLDNNNRLILDNNNINNNNNIINNNNTLFNICNGAVAYNSCKGLQQVSQYRFKTIDTNNNNNDINNNNNLKKDSVDIEQESTPKKKKVKKNKKSTEITTTITTTDNNNNNDNDINTDINNNNNINININNNKEPFSTEALSLLLSHKLPPTIPRTFTPKQRQIITKYYKNIKIPEFHKGLAKCFLFGRTKLSDARHINITDIILSWWRCPYCNNNYRRKVFDHVFIYNAQCPNCHKSPDENVIFPEDTTGRKILTSTSRSSNNNNNNNNTKNKNNNKDDNLNNINNLYASVRIAESVSDIEYFAKSGRSYAPMLAANWDTHGLKTYKNNNNNNNNENEILYVSNKLDGIRCIAAYDNNNNKIHFFSRTGVILQCCDFIEPRLLNLFKQDPDLVLDGEIYAHNVFTDFQQMVSIVKTSRERRPESVRVLQEKLEYHIFDIMYCGKYNNNNNNLNNNNNNNNFGYLARITHLHKIINSSEKNHKIKKLFVVDAVPVKIKDIDNKMEEALENGYEGIMIREKDSEYIHGKRSVKLLKYKKMYDSEYEIVDVVEGKGKFKGMAGAVICKVIINDNNNNKEIRFAANPAANDIIRRDIYNNRDRYIGEVGTVQYQELSRGGVPRFPVLKCVRGGKDGSNWL